MTDPRTLLREWLELSENRALSVETYLERSDRLAARTRQLLYPKLFRLLKWQILDKPINGVRPHEADPEAYWQARKQLERETREYMEKDDE